MPRRVACSIIYRQRSGATGGRAFLLPHWAFHLRPHVFRSRIHIRRFPRQRGHSHWCHCSDGPARIPSSMPFPNSHELGMRSIHPDHSHDILATYWMPLGDFSRTRSSHPTHPQACPGRIRPLDRDFARHSRVSHQPRVSDDSLVRHCHLARP